MTKSPRIVALGATLLLSSAAFAATGDFGKIDTNADGKITLEEGMKLHPEWTAASFKALDTNADGSLNELEYETAVTAAPAISAPTPAVSQPTQPPLRLKQAPPAIWMRLDQTTFSPPALSACVCMPCKLTLTLPRPIPPKPARSGAMWVKSMTSFLIGMAASRRSSSVWADSWALAKRTWRLKCLRFARSGKAMSSNDWFFVVNSSKEMLTNAPAYTTNTKS